MLEPWIAQILKAYHSDLGKNCIMDENYSIFPNEIRSHQIATVLMAPFNPKKLLCTLVIR